MPNFSAQTEPLILNFNSSKMIYGSENYMGVSGYKLEEQVTIDFIQGTIIVDGVTKQQLTGQGTYTDTDEFWFESNETNGQRLLKRIDNNTYRLYAGYQSESNVSYITTGPADSTDSAKGGESYVFPKYKGYMETVTNSFTFDPTNTEPYVFEDWSNHNHTNQFTSTGMHPYSARVELVLSISNNTMVLTSKDSEGVVLQTNTVSIHQYQPALNNPDVQSKKCFWANGGFTNPSTAQHPMMLDLSGDKPRLYGAQNMNDNLYSNHYNYKLIIINCFYFALLQKSNC